MAEKRQKTYNYLMIVAIVAIVAVVVLIMNSGGTSFSFSESGNVAGQASRIFTKEKNADFSTEDNRDESDCEFIPGQHIPNTEFNPIEYCESIRKECVFFTRKESHEFYDPDSGCTGDVHLQFLNEITQPCQYILFGQDVNPWANCGSGYQCSTGGIWDHKTTCETPLMGILCC